MSLSLFPECFDQYYFKKYTVRERINSINLTDISVPDKGLT